MSKIKLFTLTVFSVLIVLSSALVLTTAVPARAEETAGIAVNDTNFPDEEFRSYVARYCDDDGDGFLSDDEISRKTSIYLLGAPGTNVYDLTGIEYFTALKILDVSDNHLTSLDLSENTQLEILNCRDNNLTTLDLSSNTNLLGLNCNSCGLTSLKISDNAALISL